MYVQNNSTITLFNTFAIVSVLKNDKVVGYATSDIDGNYTIKALDAGMYDLKVVYVGYNSFLENGITLLPDRITYKNCEMSIGKLLSFYSDVITTSSTMACMVVEQKDDGISTMPGEFYSGLNKASALKESKGSRSNYSTTSNSITEKTLISGKTTYTPTSFQHKIVIPYTIPSDGRDYQVQIKEYTVPAVYEYATTPKATINAFLMANITGWSDFNLMKGKANLYYEGTYIGNSYLNLGSIDDTLKLSLGNDQSINIKRERVKDFRSKKLLSSNIKETYGWEISVRNNKKEKITINVKDQFPVSTDANIEVELEESIDAIVNNDTGELTWKAEINPGETKKFRFKYAVKYPAYYNMSLE